MLFFLLLLTCIEQNSCTIFCHFAQEIMFKYLKHRTVQTFSYLFAKSNSALLYCPLRDSMSAPLSGGGASHRQEGKPSCTAFGGYLPFRLSAKYGTVFKSQ